MISEYATSLLVLGDQTGTALPNIRIPGTSYVWGRQNATDGPLVLAHLSQADAPDAKLLAWLGKGVLIERNTDGMWSVIVASLPKT